jgi:hypothetical protein
MKVVRVPLPTVKTLTTIGLGLTILKFSISFSIGLQSYKMQELVPCNNFFGQPVAATSHCKN